MTVYQRRVAVFVSNLYKVLLLKTYTSSLIISPDVEIRPCGNLTAGVNQNSRQFNEKGFSKKVLEHFRSPQNYTKVDQLLNINKTTREIALIQFSTSFFIKPIASISFLPSYTQKYSLSFLFILNLVKISYRAEKLLDKKSRLFIIMLVTEIIKFKYLIITC